MPCVICHRGDCVPLGLQRLEYHEPKEYKCKYRYEADRRRSAGFGKKGSHEQRKCDERMAPHEKVEKDHDC